MDFAQGELDGCFYAPPQTNLHSATQRSFNAFLVLRTSHHPRTVVSGGASGHNGPRPPPPLHTAGEKVLGDVGRGIKREGGTPWGPRGGAGEFVERVTGEEQDYALRGTEVGWGRHGMVRTQATHVCAHAYTGHTHTLSLRNVFLVLFDTHTHTHIHTHTHLLNPQGQELVLWRDGGGTWRAFRDACPHRLAPLSEGRIEADGTLLCAYHGAVRRGGRICREREHIEFEGCVLRRVAESRRKRVLTSPRANFACAYVGRSVSSVCVMGSVAA